MYNTIDILYGYKEREFDMAAIIIIMIIVVIGSWIVSGYRGLADGKKSVEEAEKNLDDCRRRKDELVLDLSEKLKDTEKHLIDGSSEIGALKEDLKKAEDAVADAEKYHRSVSLLYNTAVTRFPSSLVAKVCRFRTIE